ncbi:hypothetical protein B0T19DRAFT_60456 [Cercophora scortea]|uniref:Uncharacterized protein n=1 Tax=Cercophora scortea TaxID=314031 RepID=A0AAE0MM13_9PEZI|nr:hypothetical protein B0T19DRAFT_60456 [Cercophora scortea]
MNRGAAATLVASIFSYSQLDGIHADTRPPVCLPGPVSGTQHPRRATRSLQVYNNGFKCTTRQSGLAVVHDNGAISVVFALAMHCIASSPMPLQRLLWEGGPFSPGYHIRWQGGKLDSPSWLAATITTRVGCGPYTAACSVCLESGCEARVPSGDLIPSHMSGRGKPGDRPAGGRAVKRMGPPTGSRCPARMRGPAELIGSPQPRQPPTAALAVERGPRELRTETWAVDQASLGWDEPQLCNRSQATSVNCSQHNPGLPSGNCRGIFISCFLPNPSSSVW